MAGVVERPRHLRQRVLVERQQGADVDVVAPLIVAVSMMSSGRKLMAAAPPAASCALATRLMVTKLVKDCASGVVSRTVRTASAICSCSDGCVCGDIRVFGDSSLIIIAPYDGLDQQVQRVRRVAFLNSRTAAGSPALCPSTLWPNMDIVSCVS